jgi:hypothetical protein
MMENQHPWKNQRFRPPDTVWNTKMQQQEMAQQEITPPRPQIG